jgi:tRNA modification GTPase
MEDVVEINSHGGPAVTNKILEILLSYGCVLAGAGEFTKRAFLNGRIDLVEAEAVQDLITSESEKSRKLAINQLTGTVSSLVNDIRKNILDIQANIEVNIDYPEYEEGEKYTRDALYSKVDQIKIMLTKLLNGAENGKIIKNGINVALLGKPNVGKSSILNSLLEEDKAIVTEIAGTTRDVVEGKLVLDGIVLNVIDTAGIRETNDVVEKIGVERSLKSADEADLVIYVVSSENLITEEDLSILNKIKDKNKKFFVFVNKNDLASNKICGLLDDEITFIYGNTVDEDGLNDL